MKNGSTRISYIHWREETSGLLRKSIVPTRENPTMLFQLGSSVTIIREAEPLSIGDEPRHGKSWLVFRKDREN